MSMAEAGFLHIFTFDIACDRRVIKREARLIGGKTSDAYTGIGEGIQRVEGGLSENGRGRRL